MAFCRHCLLGIAYLIVAVSCIDGSACDRSQNRLLCRMVSRVINCSVDGGDTGGQVAYFVQPQPEDNPHLISLSLDAEPDLDFSVASLSGLVSCFMLPGSLRLELAPGSGECSLLSGSLDSLADIHVKLTLQVRLAGSRIPLGLFSSRLSSLRNLQLETLKVTEVQAGAFAELRRLERLSLTRLQLDRLEGSLLRGLSTLRILELTNNKFTVLDSDSFAASPLLEMISLRTALVNRLSVTEDTFCRLSRLRDLTILEAANLNCSHFASRKLHLRLTSGGLTSQVSCVRMLGESTVCGGPAGIRWTSAISPTTSAVTNAAITTSIGAKPGKTTKVDLKTSATRTPTRSVSTRTSTRRGETETTLQTSKIISTVTTSTPIRTSSATASSSTTLLEPSRRSDKQPKPSATAKTTAGPIIAGVLIGAVLLLALASVGIFLATRQGRLRRSRSQQPIMYSAASVGHGEIDMQDAIWNPHFQEGGFHEDASTDAVVERED